MTPPTDLELVCAAQAGDKRAFGQLIERYQIPAIAIAARLVAGSDMAYDLVQEALLRAYLALDSLREPAAFPSWLYGIVINVCREYRRSRRTRFGSLEALAGGLVFDALPFAEGEPGPQEIAEMRELHADVLAAVAALSPANRDVTLLFYYEDLSVREIAALLGITTTAVKGRLHKSRRLLKERLEPLRVREDREKRESEMIQVTVMDMVKDPVTDHRVVVLMDGVGQRILPIWVGPYEGDAIAMRLLEQTTPRPLTYNLMANLLDVAGATLDSVRVEALRDNTFYAVAQVRAAGQEHEIDARPSDAIALALRTSSPIFVAEEVMARVGIGIPEPFRQSPQRRGLDQYAQDLSQEQARREQEVAAASTEDESKAARARLLAYVFGAESAG